MRSLFDDFLGLLVGNELVLEDSDDVVAVGLRLGPDYRPSHSLLLRHACAMAFLFDRSRDWGNFIDQSKWASLQR